MGNLEKYALVGVVVAIISYFLATRQTTTQITQPVTEKTTIIQTTPPFYEVPTIPETPEEPMEYGSPEETGAGGYTPIVTSTSDCFMECLNQGYLNGTCMWSSEAPSYATKIIDCYIEGSRHCGNVGQCGCYCWGSYEG